MTRDDWLALAKRCEEATGSDRDIDKAIAVGCGWCLHLQKTWSGAQDDTGFTCDHCGADSWGNRGKTGQRLSEPTPATTGSLDVITGLIKRELSGHPHGYMAGWFGKGTYGGIIGAADGSADLLKSVIKQGKSPALALCAAFCRAMAEKA